MTIDLDPIPLIGQAGESPLDDEVHSDGAALNDADADEPEADPDDLDIDGADASTEPS
ncbi:MULTISPECIES: hypothetical protein [unclassified Pseudomonas]|nr:MULTISPECIES: hypothetical protein [unclassified Pseudomonas]MBD8595414.1 hypothetical protein [Pseudomonas sp. CFBP 8758]MBD8621416.1 hypothetical protein [Pseudomonas sp. CFBP 13727]MBD8825065.1 hypothetical protein [Pseudomonas sp. CFBP 13602]